MFDLLSSSRMDFELSDVQLVVRDHARRLGRSLAPDSSAAEVVASASRVGLTSDSLAFGTAALAIETLACESAAAAMMLALHLVAVRAASGSEAETLIREGTIGSLSLSTEAMPSIDGGTLTGRAAWVGSVSNRGVAIVGVRQGGQVTTHAVALDAPGLALEPIATSGLRGVSWAHLTFSKTPCVVVSTPAGIMAGARTLIAAVAIGIGARALQESLAAAERYRGAGGEQTVQGLLADTATALDAARVLAWKAAFARGGPSVAQASMAKLAATDAAQGAVVRATQVVGVDSFRHGHVIERLTQDVRAIELFAGRTEALREAVADEELPHV